MNGRLCFGDSLGAIIIPMMISIIVYSSSNIYIDQRFSKFGMSYVLLLIPDSMIDRYLHIHIESIIKSSRL